MDIRSYRKPIATNIYKVLQAVASLPQTVASINYGDWIQSGARLLKRPPRNKPTNIEPEMPRHEIRRPPDWPDKLRSKSWGWHDDLHF